MVRILLLFMSLAFIACNNESSTEAELDSLENKVDSTFNAIKDTVEAKAERLEDSIDHDDQDTTHQNR